jgi:hypothetical protein
MLNITDSKKAFISRIHIQEVNKNINRYFRGNLGSYR